MRSVQNGAEFVLEGRATDVMVNGITFKAKSYLWGIARYFIQHYILCQAI